jgi:hypothetical protein
VGPVVLKTIHIIWRTRLFNFDDFGKKLSRFIVINVTAEQVIVIS